MLAQIGPWPPERAVITLQSDLAGEMASLRRWYSEQQVSVRLPSERASSERQHETEPLRGQASIDSTDTEG